jgi:hypothetical protein
MKMAPVLSIALAIGQLAGNVCDVSDEYQSRPGSFDPAPSRLPYAAIVGNGLLVLQWQNTNPRGDKGDLSWFWCNLATSHVQPLQAAMPMTARTISQVTRLPTFLRNSRYTDHVHRWRIGKAFLWITSYVDFTDALTSRENVVEFPFPMESVPDGRIPPLTARPDTDIPLDPKDRAEIAANGMNLPDGYRDVISEERGVYLDTGLDPIFRAKGNLYRQGIQRPCAAYYRADFDILPIARQRYKFVLLIDEELSIWQYSFGQAESPRSYEIDGVWQRQGVCRTTLKERFHAAEADGQIFFVTDSGAVYMAEGAKDTWTSKEVWSNNPRPIISMLSNSEDNGAYVFGKDFYFKLGKKIEVKPCRDVTKREAKETNKDLEKLEPSARLAYECGRVLYEKGELKPEPAKK